jgi:hypothetical protein
MSPAFEGHVVGLSGVAHFADDGDDVDHAAPAFLHHALHDGLHGEERAAEVGLQDDVPVFGLHAQGETVLGDSGVVDQNANGAEIFCGLGEGGLNRIS